jgi:hypothetical protein
MLDDSTTKLGRLQELVDEIKKSSEPIVLTSLYCRIVGEVTQCARRTLSNLFPLRNSELREITERLCQTRRKNESIIVLRWDKEQEAAQLNFHGDRDDMIRALKRAEENIRLHPFADTDNILGSFYLTRRAERE